MIRENITTGDIPFRKAYLKFVVNEIIVDDKQVHVVGSKHVVLEPSPILRDCRVL